MPVSDQDFITGFDPTGQPNITGSQLNALIESGTPYTDKGLNLVSDDVAGNPDVPDAATTTKWQRYLWIRRMVTSVVAYAWNPNAATDATYLKWQQINVSGLADFSVTNTKIYPGAVTDDKITSVSYGKIIAAPTSLPPSGNATGDLTGTYPAPIIGANKVDGTKLLSDALDDSLRAVGGNHIKNGVVDFTRHILVGASAFSIPLVNSTATNWSFTQIPILQAKAKLITHGTNASTAVVWPADNTTPLFSEGSSVTSLNITPFLSASIIRIRFSCVVGRSVDGGVGIAAFIGAAAGIAAGTAASQFANSSVVAGSNSQIVLDAVVPSPGVGVASTVAILFANTVAGTAYMNEASATPFYGGTRNSFLIVEEYTGTLT